MSLKLVDIATFSQGKQIDISEQYNEPQEGLIRFLRIIDYTNLNEPYRYVKNYGESFLVEPKDIVVIRYGSQTAGKVVRGFQGLIANNMFKINLKMPFNKDFLYYYLSRDEIFNYLRNGQSSSTMPAITFANMNNIEIPEIPDAQQRHIVDILGTLDNKIENLSVINIKLQEFCLKKYHLLFQDCDKIPLSKIANITMGQSPSGNSLNENKDGVIFYQGRTDFGFRYPSVRLYTNEPKRLAKKGDILLSVRAPVGDINIAPSSCCIGRGIASISSDYNSFIYYALLSQKEDFNIYNQSGTIFGSINKDALSNFTVPASNRNKIQEFLSYSQSIDLKIENNTLEIEKYKELKSLYLKKFFG